MLYIYISLVTAVTEKFNSHFFFLTLKLFLSLFLLACYIEIDDDGAYDEADENEIKSQWDSLPDLLLEQIFSYLTISER